MMTPTRPRSLPAIAALLALALAAPIASAEFSSVWVEGESGESENIQPNSWYLSVRAQDLSGGAWLATYGGAAPALARYAVQIPKDGNYTLWVRANPISASLSARVGADGDWLPVPISSDKIDSVNIAADSKPDMRFLAWAKAGSHKLEAGETELHFRMDSKNGNHGAIDCFALTTDSGWKPAGTKRPGEAAPSWETPVINDDNLAEWSSFIFPAASELGWRKIRWHRHLDEAAAEARALGRPILLWSMNGHPCGET